MNSIYLSKNRLIYFRIQGLASVPCTIQCNVKSVYILEHFIVMMLLELLRIHRPLQRGSFYISHLIHNESLYVVQAAVAQSTKDQNLVQKPISSICLVFNFYSLP